MEKPFSDSDIRPYIHNILVYSDLEHITPSQLLNMLEEGPIGLLYQETPSVGHWTLLDYTFDNDGNTVVEFFDPYSYMPDTEFDLLEYKQPHYLAQALYKLSQKVPIHYNHYKFQRKGPNINTCGRWIILRSLFNYLPLEYFAKLITVAAERLGLTPDELSVRAFQK